ncbi:hypothetical protein [Sorangium sp. So ce861]|uniref:hypothetical protein n=1 Tax=Sorangium sp. So ce861 TaxID=3133323 RepID=UPI003F644404
MPYSKAQCIAYQIDTFPTNDNTAGNLYRRKYLSNANDDAADIRSRCNIMTDVIILAKRCNEIDVSQGTLKIFMAPEFYFRGSKGAYSVESLSLIMEEMRKLTKNPAYKDWLFVFGTSLGFLEDGFDSLGHHKEVFNVAMIQKGGKDKSENGSSLIVYKEYVSHIDFIRNSYHLTCSCGRLVQIPWDLTVARLGLIGSTTGGMSVLRPTQGSRDVMTRREETGGGGREASQSGLGGQGYFVIDGITFGLEVCLDHARARLRSSPPLGEYYAQIHLIPSAGMTIQKDSVVCTTNGLIFNVDGGGAGAHAHLLKNTGTYDKPVLFPGAPPNVIAPAKSLNIQNVLPRGVAADKYFSGPGMLHIFASEDIPKPVPAPPKLKLPMRP